MTGQEGVIRFRFEHRRGALPRELAGLAAELAGWRRVLVGLGVVGQQPGRYGGFGFGNLSGRVGRGEAPPGRRSFLVTGSQTGHLPDLDLGGFALVDTWDAAAHRLTSRGTVEPSSESLTHAALYDAAPWIGAVFHVHAPTLWARRGCRDLPQTAAGIDYGTPEMAAAVARLCRAGDGLPQPAAGLLAMAGHEDGILAYAADPETAGRTLLAALSPDPTGA